MPRSALSVAWATCQPAFSSPTSWRPGITTSSRNISQKCDSPVAWRIGRTSMPGRRHVQEEVGDAAPLGRVGVGARQQQAPVGVPRPAGPDLLAVHEVAAVDLRGRWSAGWPGRTRRRARRSPGTRSRRPGSPAGGGGAAPRCRLQQRGGGMVDGHERQHQPGRVVGGQLLEEHDLPPVDMPAAPLGGPVRHRVPGAAAPGTTPAGSATNSSSDAPVCASRQPAGTCARHHSRTSARNSSSSARHVRSGPCRLRREVRHPSAVLLGLHRDGLGGETGLHRAPSARRGAC